MGAAKVERSTSPLVTCSISPSQGSSTNPTVDSATSYYSPAMDMDPKDMPETAFVIAFCVKFRSAINNITFWPEDLDEAICCKEGPHVLIESLHKAFIQNLELKKLRTSWVKRLAKLINDWREKGHDFFADHNPIERTNYDYYGMSNRDKIMIMQVLVSWQLAESPEIKRIRKEHNEIVNDDDVKPLEVEVLGEDTSGSRYYYIGVGVRIYRESMISGRVKWETVSSTVEELKKFIFDYQGLDPNRSDQERILYNKLVNTVLPYLEPLENERKRLKELKEDVLSKVERDRELRLKKIEKDHNDSEILLVRTRSQAKQSIHKKVKNTTGYLEIIKNPTDPVNITINNEKKVVVNTSDVDPSKRKVMDNDDNTIKDPENPTTIQEAVESKDFVNEVINPITSSEDKDFAATNKIIDPATSGSIQKAAEKDIIEGPSTEISKPVETAIESKGLLDVTVADTLDGATSEDLSDRDDKRPNKNERTEKVTTLDNSSSKMNLSTILTEEVSREAESVEQRSELSKMSILNILSSESSDVVHTDNKYFDESEMDNGNNEHAFVQYGNGSVVSYEFDTIVQKSNNKTSTENEKAAPVVAVKEQNEQNNMQQDSNTPNISNDTIKTPWAPAIKKNRKEKTEEVDDDALNEPKIKRAFVPDEETMVKLEWSLNHPVFRLDEEIFGESTETDLSDCCSDCAMEVD